MAAVVVARPAVRPAPRARDEEVLVWPDLVFVEFISALLFTVALFFLSFAMNAPLLDEANANVTNDPAKAPWYLLNLQELLLHMNPALAGIIVPTVWLILLGAFPYFDQATEGQGRWFADANSIRNTVVSYFVGFLGTLALILWNSGKVALWLKGWFGISGGGQLAFLERSAALKDPSIVPWPDWASSIPYLWFNLKILDEGPGAGVTTFQKIDLPTLLVDIGIPAGFMVGLTCLLIYAFWRIGWVLTRRDALITLMSGFVGVFLMLTIIGTAFRGPGQDLIWPWDLRTLEGIPGQE